MSDLILKGMSMPKGITYIIIDPEDKVVSEKIGDMYHVTTEAVEIPDHGPLTDINKLKDKFRRAAEVCEATNKPERAKHWRDAEALVNESEIILKGTEDNGL